MLATKPSLLTPNYYIVLIISIVRSYKLGVRSFGNEASLLTPNF